MLEAFGTFRRSEKGNSGLIFVPARMVNDSMFPIHSNGPNVNVKIRIQEGSLVVEAANPVRLWIGSPRGQETSHEVGGLTELYEFLRPRFRNKMWRRMLLNMFFAIAKDGHWSASTMHYSIEATFHVSDYFRARRVAKSAGLIEERMGGDVVVGDEEAVARFVRGFDASRVR